MDESATQETTQDNSTTALAETAKLQLSGHIWPTKCCHPACDMEEKKLKLTSLLSTFHLCENVITYLSHCFLGCV